MNIIFIGYRGTGKTVVGKKIAMRFRRNFVDIDQEIIKSTRKSIKRIFEEEGEAAFRKIETETIKRICKADTLVIAFGGGAVMNSENVKVAKRNGAMILLIANPKTIYNRICMDASRPRLTKEPDLMHEIKRNLKERMPTYEKVADYVISSEGKTPGQVVMEAERILEKAGIKKTRRSPFRPKKRVLDRKRKRRL